VLMMVRSKRWMLGVVLASGPVGGGFDGGGPSSCGVEEVLGPGRRASALVPPERFLAGGKQLEIVVGAPSEGVPATHLVTARVHRVVSLLVMVLKLAQVVVPSWAEWASSAMTRSAAAAPVAWWSTIAARSPSAKRPAAAAIPRPAST